MHGLGRAVCPGRHVIDFEEGGKQKVQLLRKGNDKLPYLVKLGDAGEQRASGAGGLMEDHGYTAEEVEELEELARQQLDDEQARLLELRARQQEELHGLADDEGDDLEDDGDETDEEESHTKSRVSAEAPP